MNITPTPSVWDNCTIYYDIFYNLVEREAEFNNELGHCVYIYRLTLLAICLIGVIIVLLLGMLGFFIYHQCNKRKRAKERQPLISSRPETLPDLLTALHNSSDNTLSDILDTYRYYDAKHKRRWKGELFFSFPFMTGNPVMNGKGNILPIILEPGYIYEGMESKLTITNQGPRIQLELSTYALFSQKESYQVRFYPANFWLEENTSITVLMEIIITKPEVIQGLVVIKGSASSPLSRGGSSIVGRGGSSISPTSDVGRGGKEYFSPYYLPLKLRGLPLVEESLLVESSDLSGGELIGQGAAAGVYRMQYRGRQIAVKKYRIPELTPQDVDAFVRELRILQQVQHPCVVKLVAACTTFPNLMVAMEYLPYGSLRKVLDTSLHSSLVPGKNEGGDPFSSITDGNTRERNIPLRLKFAIDAARGLSYLHMREIIHRDVKSDNCLISSLNPNDSVCLKITDFSLGKFGTKKEKGSEVGSIHWASPELILGGKADFASDVWAYGVVCYEIITGQVPYHTFRFHHDIEKFIKDGNKLTLSIDDCRGYPDDFRDLVYSCWLPGERRPSFAEITTQLYQMSYRPTHWNPTLPSRLRQSGDIRGVQI